MDLTQLRDLPDNIEHIKIQDVPEVALGEAEWERLQTLTRLQILKTTQPHSYTLYELLQHCTSLAQLEMSVDMPEACLPALPTTLTHLECGMDAACLTALATLPLRHLYFQSSPYFKEFKPSNDFWKSISFLESLQLTSSRLPDVLKDALSALPNLTALYLMSDTCFSFPTSWHQLTHLTLRTFTNEHNILQLPSSTSLTYLCLDVVGKMPPGCDWPDLPNLQSLKLFKLNCLPALYDKLAQYDQLSTLHIRQHAFENPSTPSQALATAFSHLTQLTDLNMHILGWDNEDCLQVLSALPRSLVILHCGHTLRHCKEPLALWKCLAELTHLQELHAHALPGTSQAELAACLAKCGFDKLKDLGISEQTDSCHILESVCEASQHFTALTSLQLGKTAVLESSKF